MRFERGSPKAVAGVGRPCDLAFVRETNPTVILVTDEMRIIAMINCGGTKCLTELIKWDAVLQLCN